MPLAPPSPPTSPVGACAVKRSLRAAIGASATRGARGARRRGGESAGRGCPFLAARSRSSTPPTLPPPPVCIRVDSHARPYLSLGWGGGPHDGAGGAPKKENGGGRAARGRRRQARETAPAARPWGAARGWWRAAPGAWPACKGGARGNDAGRRPARPLPPHALRGQPVEPGGRGEGEEGWAGVGGRRAGHRDRSRAAKARARPRPPATPPSPPSPFLTGARVHDRPPAGRQRAARRLREFNPPRDRGLGVAPAQERRRQRRRDRVARAPVGRKLAQLAAARVGRFGHAPRVGVDSGARRRRVLGGVRFEGAGEVGAGAGLQLGAEQGAGDGVGWRGRRGTGRRGVGGGGSAGGRTPAAAGAGGCRSPALGKRAPTRAARSARAPPRRAPAPRRRTPRPGKKPDAQLRAGAAAAPAPGGALAARGAMVDPQCARGGRPEGLGAARHSGAGGHPPAGPLCRRARAACDPPPRSPRAGAAARATRAATIRERRMLGGGRGAWARRNGLAAAAGRRGRDHGAFRADRQLTHVGGGGRRGRCGGEGGRVGDGRRAQPRYPRARPRKPRQLAGEALRHTLARRPPTGHSALHRPTPPPAPPPLTPRPAPGPA